MSDLILVLICGSSSIKFALFDTGRIPLDRASFWRGQVDSISGPAPSYRETGAEPAPLALDPAAPYRSALAQIARRVDARRRSRGIAAIAHRVVHGGPRYFDPVRVDAAMLADLRSYIPLAPLHQPFALEAIEHLLEQRPNLAQVACFDTAFHHTMPQVERMLPLSWDAWERGIRRYGFHGLSYEYQSIALPERHGELARGRIIVAHLGNGASLCGMRELRSVATSMGFSALDGLMMGTRPGAVDPGVLLHLMETDGLGPAELAGLLYHRSGFLGLSGISADPRELLAQEDAQPRARAALELYVRRAVREIGSMTAALGGLDLLVFTAGIGEHNATLRTRICEGLGFMGIALDSTANQVNASVISSEDSAIRVAVEPTNEEWIAALRAHELLRVAG
jgi:acetate kinase